MRGAQTVESPDGGRWRVRRRWMDRSLPGLRGRWGGERSGGAAIEAALAVLGSGIVGRLVLRRPWIVEATNLEHRERSVAFAVRGWRRSGEAIVELTRAIPAGGPPVRLADGVAIPASAERSGSGRRAGR